MSKSVNFPTPKELVKKLDQYIIGQEYAKRVLATESFKRHVSGYTHRDNILLDGPSGTGKTMCAQTLAKILDIPFISVDITTFSETGYVGHNVDEIPRTLLIECLSRSSDAVTQMAYMNNPELACKSMAKMLFPTLAPASLDSLTSMIQDGTLDEFEVEAVPDLQQRYAGHQYESQEPFIPMRVARAVCAVPLSGGKAKTAGTDLINAAISRSIVLIDEIDKLGGGGDRGGPDVSRGGVQRSLLALLQGNKYHVNAQGEKGGPTFPVDTSKVLFVGAGAFQQKGLDKMSLMPELRGRFGKYATLNALTREDYRRILTEPVDAPSRRYESLFNNAGVKLTLEDSGIATLTDYIEKLNETDNLGARRVNSVFASVADEAMYNIDTLGGELRLDEASVKEILPLERLLDQRNTSLADYSL